MTLFGVGYGPRGFEDLYYGKTSAKLKLRLNPFHIRDCDAPISRGRNNSSSLRQEFMPDPTIQIFNAYKCKERILKRLINKRS
jgi:hypothetical protein